MYIEVVEDYFLKVDDLNYTLMTHERDKNGNLKFNEDKSPKYKSLNRYYGTVEQAIEDILERRAKEKLKGAKIKHTLQEAIEVLRKNTKEFNELLEKCLAERS